MTRKRFVLNDLKRDKPWISLKSWRWMGPIPASFVLFSIFGLIYGNGVFVALVDKQSFTNALGLSLLCTSWGVTVSGIALHRASSPRLYEIAPKVFGVISSLCLLCQTLMAIALSLDLSYALFAASVFLGLGSGSNYMVAITVIQAWLPERPGVSTGVGMFFGASGSVIGVYLYRVAAARLGGPIQAMKAAGILSALATFAASLLISRPPLDWDPEVESYFEDEGLTIYRPIEDGVGSREDEEPVFAEDYELSRSIHRVELSKLLGPDARTSETILGSISPEHALVSPTSSKFSQPFKGSNMSMLAMLGDTRFYIFLVSVVSAMTPGTGIIVGFPHMVSVLFRIDVDKASRLFFWVSIAAVCGRFLTGLAIDVFDDRGKDPSGIIGSKRVCHGVLALQAAAIMCILVFIRFGNAIGFTVAAAVVYFCFSGGAVVAACLARSIFTLKNAALAFSLMGIATGLFDMFFTRLIASCSIANTDVSNSNADIHSFDKFFIIGLVMTSCGLVSSLFIGLSDVARRLMPLSSKEKQPC